MKIIVTGGAGYIGSFTVRALKDAGHTPVIIDDLSSGHEEAVKDFKLINFDLTKEKNKLFEIFKQEKPDGVIHMASFIQMGESFKDPGKYFQANLTTALNILDVMVKHNAKYFVLSSSAGVYGNPDKLPITEDTATNPLNPYGETKLMIEKFLYWYEKAHDIKYSAIRYFNAAGAALDGSIGEDHPDESHIIPLAVSKLMKDEEFTIFGDDYETPDGTCVRDYIHVLDLAAAHVKALEYMQNKNESLIANAGVGEGYSNKQIIEKIEQVSGQKMKIKYGARREGDADQLFAANDKIKEKLNWQPKYGLTEIIESAYLWHTKHPEGYES